MIELPEIPIGENVPRVIHQIYFNTDLPEHFRENIAALKERNPDWEYRFFDTKCGEDFIRETYGPDMLALFRRIDPAYYAARSDFLRYLICYAEGGVYLDMKSTADRPLDELLHPDDRFLLTQWYNLRHMPPALDAHRELRHVQGSEYCNWAIITVPGHPFLRAVIEKMVANIEAYQPFIHGVGGQGVLRLTGPVAYTLAIHEIRMLHPHRLVYLDPEEGFRYSIYGDVFTHKSKHDVHYSELVHPIVSGSPFTRALSIAVYGYLVPFARRLVRAVTKRLPGARKA